MSEMVFNYASHTSAIFYILFVQRRRDQIFKKGEHFLALRTMSFIGGEKKGIK